MQANPGALIAAKLGLGARIPSRKLIIEVLHGAFVMTFSKEDAF